MRSILRKISEAYENAGVICYECMSRFVIMSDIHRGAGNKADNFLQNKSIFNAAIRHYYNKGFCYIEAGDGDELWENKGYEKICAAHRDTFELIQKFADERRLIEIFGNHDRVKEGEECEAVILKNGDHEIFIVHGHQGDFINDFGWRIGRFLVRNVWRRLELFGINDPTRAAYNDKKQNKTEAALAKWASKNKVMLIAGHTHRIKFPMPGRGLYFNDGCCVYSGYITAIEIENQNICLVKWSIDTNEKMLLEVKRTCLYGPVRLSDYFSKTIPVKCAE